MRFLGWTILAALVLLALFTVANWTLFAAPATLDLLIMTVQGPLGLILLGATLVFIALFGVYVLSLRTATVVETRRHLRALESQRELADKAEASRLAELSARLEQEFSGTRALIAESRAQTIARVDALDVSLARTFNETSNAVFANIAQVDDKLEKIAAHAEAKPR